MTVIRYTSAAKCKDCRYCNSFYDGKQKRHRCSNPESSRYDKKYGEKTITLNELVCNKWQIK